VSTQLIEAGVDIDFPTVFREIAGIDSLAQAAGRCNREGKLPGLGRLNIFWTEDPLPPGMLRNTAQTARRVMPENDDILGLRMVERYFKELLFNRDTDVTHVFALAADAKRSDRMNFDFPEVARRYRLISEDSQPVVILLDDEARRLVEALELGFGKRELLRRLQPYVVQVRWRRLRELLAAGAVRSVAGTVTVLERRELYDPVLGMLSTDPTERDPQELMVE
jgi:CRISPR-associated endonuclease/helicase Cas3